MAKRHHHYEAAFEDFLRRRRWPYVPVDERRRATLAGASLKSFDFLVYPPGGGAWMVDVKGRKFPYELPGGKRYWENWVTRDDLVGLQGWRQAFGDGFEPTFVFAYWLLDSVAGGGPRCNWHMFGGRAYGFVRVSATSYADCARRRSPKWKTVAVVQSRFRQLAQPLDELGTACL